MRTVVVSLLLSVFVFASWASAQLAGPTVPPSAPRAGEPTTVSTAPRPAGPVAKKRVVRRVVVRKRAAKPLALKTAKPAKAVKGTKVRRAPARHPVAPARSQV